MKTLFLFTILALFIVLGGCGDDDNGGSNNGGDGGADSGGADSGGADSGGADSGGADNGGADDVCRQAFEKVGSCLKNLDCNTITDVTAKMTCEAMKKIYEVSYDDWVATCEKKTPGQCSCVGETKTTAEQFKSCTLDDTCTKCK